MIQGQERVRRLRKTTLESSTCSSSTSKEGDQPSLELVPVFQFTFPDDCDIPSHFTQAAKVPGVPCHIGLQLRFPEASVAPGHSISTAIVLMPEAAVNEYYLPSMGKDKVGPSGKTFASKNVSVAQSMQQSADKHFWAGVAVTNQRHPLASFRRGQRVGRQHGETPLAPWILRGFSWIPRRSSGGRYGQGHATRERGPARVIGEENPGV